MDHVTISLGGSCMRIGPGMWEVKPLKALEGTIWVLAYSGEPKDTMGHLRRCKGDRLAILEELGGSWDASIEGKDLDQDKRLLIKATLTNRDAEAEATKLWLNEESIQGPLGKRLGSLMLRHHEALRDGLGLSTPKLEAMREAAMSAGAWGYKLVGSGGGGCAVAWASTGKADTVLKAMMDAGAKNAWKIEKPGEGAKVES